MSLFYDFVDEMNPVRSKEMIENKETLNVTNTMPSELRIYEAKLKWQRKMVAA